MTKYKVYLTICISFIGIAPMICVLFFNNFVNFGSFYIYLSLLLSALIVFYSKNVSNWLLAPIDNDLKTIIEVLNGKKDDDKSKSGKHNDGFSILKLFGNKNGKIYSSQEFHKLILDISQLVNKLQDTKKQINDAVKIKTQNYLESERKTNRERAYYKGVFDSLPTALLLLDSKRKLLSANNIFKRDFIMKHSFYKENYRGLQSELIKLFKEENRNEIIKIIGEYDEDKIYDQDLEFEWQLRNEKKVYKVNYIPLRDSINKKSKPYAYIIKFREVTEEVGLEVDLQQAQKMNGVGSMAGGLAHDFNNILTTVIGNLEIIELNSETQNNNSELRQAVKSALLASNEGANIAKQLLQVSRKEKLQRENLTLNDITDNTKTLLKSSIPKKIDIKYNLNDNLKHILADKTQLSQCLLNMCFNARDAINGASGKIEISTKDINISKSHRLVKEIGLSPGDYSVLSVEDNGQGIRDEIKDKIFEPLFTTKEKEKGTGFGLSMIKSIVTKHKGIVTVDSEYGKGSVFSLYFPINKDKILIDKNISKNKAVNAPPPPTPLNGNNGKLDIKHEDKKIPKEPVKIDGYILIVEDDPGLRQIAGTALKKFGYKSLEAENGKIAINKISKYGNEIKLILLDISMPVLSGKDTFKIIRERKNTTPVILCSGFSLDSATIKSETGYVPEGCLNKPYNFKQLSESINKVYYKTINSKLEQKDFVMA